MGIMTRQPLFYLFLPRQHVFENTAGDTGGLIWASSVGMNTDSMPFLTSISPGGTPAMTAVGINHIIESPLGYLGYTSAIEPLRAEGLVAGIAGVIDQEPS
jgi:hypothetical protein